MELFVDTEALIGDFDRENERFTKAKEGEGKYTDNEEEGEEVITEYYRSNSECSGDNTNSPVPVRGTW